MAKEKEDIKARRSKFRVVLLAIILLLIPIHLVDVFIYPETEIIPADFFFAAVVVQLFFLWLDDIKEKHRILWVQKKKEELNKMKSKFALISSHELMTPISVIKGYMSLMMDKLLGELTEKQKNALDIMNKYFMRLEEIKNNLTRLYAGASPSFEENLKPSSIEVIVRTTADDIMPFVKKRNQNLSTEIERNIPHVMMDRGGIRQALVNLLLNAIRFTPDNGRIIIRANDDKDNIRVEVQDNGIGIPKDKLSNIFESFYEVQDTDKHSSGSIEFKSGGMGLGLTIAKNIIDAHKGKIWAESEVDKFSNFIFTIPKRRKNE